MADTQKKPPEPASQMKKLGKRKKVPNRGLGGKKRFGSFGPGERARADRRRSRAERLAQSKLNEIVDLLSKLHSPISDRVIEELRQCYVDHRSIFDAARSKLAATGVDLSSYLLPPEQKSSMLNEMELDYAETKTFDDQEMIDKNASILFDKYYDLLPELISQHSGEYVAVFVKSETPPFLVHSDEEALRAQAAKLAKPFEYMILPIQLQL